MTALQLTIITVLLEHYEALFSPVLQHLTHGVVVHTGTLHRHRLLHSLLEGELRVESLEDGVVLAASLSLTACVVATLEGVLYAVAEEVEGILQ